MSGAVQKRRKELRTELSLIEKQIFDLETTYLEETRDLGNVFSGWDAYISADKQKVKKVVGNDERLFSLSSVTSPASRKEDAKDRKGEKDKEKEMEKEDGDQKVGNDYETQVGDSATKKRKVDSEDAANANEEQEE